MSEMEELYKSMFIKFISCGDIDKLIMVAIEKYVGACSGCAMLMPFSQQHMCVMQNAKFHAIIKFMFLKSRSGMSFLQYRDGCVDFYFEHLSRSGLIKNCRFLPNEFVVNNSIEEDAALVRANLNSRRLILDSPNDLATNQLQFRVSVKLIQEFNALMQRMNEILYKVK